MRFLYIAIIFLSFSTSVFALEDCGSMGLFQERITDCSQLNSESEEFIKMQKLGFSLVTVNGEYKFWRDDKTGHVWSPQFSKEEIKGGLFRRRCKKPYKRAKKRHYKKVTANMFERKKGYFHCISDSLDEHILIPNNRYLYFK